MRTSISREVRIYKEKGFMTDRHMDITSCRIADSAVPENYSMPTEIYTRPYKKNFMVLYRKYSFCENSLS